MKIKCTAKTCIYYTAGICRAMEIQLEDFEYYEDIQGKEKDYSLDDMKCITYKSIYKED